VVTAIMADVMVRIDLIMAHTGSRAFMVRHHTQFHTASQPGHGHRE
jgi:hypothetical protein